MNSLDLTFERIFNSSPCLFTVQNRDLIILEANDCFTTIFGPSKGKSCYSIYKNRQTKCPDCPVEQTFKTGLTTVSEQVVAFPDGTRMPFVFYTSPIYGDNKEVIAVAEMAVDISPVKKLEKKLEESRGRFRLLFEEVPCYISVQDRNLRIIQSNRKFREDFGGENKIYCYEAYKHRKEPCLNCPVAQTFNDGKSHQSEEILTSKRGDQINTLVSTAPIRNSKGEIEYVMEMSANITQIRNLQGQLTNLGLLVGSISHGIKGLLTGLDGGMYLMNTGINKNKSQRIEEGWGMIRRNVDHIRSIVLDLLYVAKEREPELELIDLAYLAHNSARILQKRAEDLQIDFKVEIDSGIGEFNVDSKALSASLINLLENAFDACRVDRSKTEHQVRFQISTDGDNAIFKVEDNGVGMDRETREKIFSLFFSSKGSEGTGLGLFVANKVIEKHKGIIEVESTPGKGSCFTIRIPKNRA